LFAAACGTKTPASSDSDPSSSRRERADAEKARQARDAQLQIAAGIDASLIDPKAPPIPTDADFAAARADLQAYVSTHPRLAAYYADGKRKQACWLNPLGGHLSDLQVTFYCEVPFEVRFCNSLALRKVDENTELNKLERLERKMQRYQQCRVGMGALYDSLAKPFNFDGFRRGGHTASGKVSSVYYWVFLRADDYVAIRKHQAAKVDATFDPASLVVPPAPEFDRTDAAAFAELAPSTNDFYFQWMFAPLRSAVVNPVTRFLKLDEKLGLTIDELEAAAAKEFGEWGAKNILPRLGR
jgi:hypothetical protein